MGRRPKTWEDIESALIGLVDRVTRRMRKAGRVGRTITLRLRFDDFTRSTRSVTLPQATAHTETILRRAQRLLFGELARIESEGLTLVGVAVSNLADDGALQLALPFDRHTIITLDEAVDGVRERFGVNAVTRGGHLGKDLGLAVPLFPISAFDMVENQSTCGGIEGRFGAGSEDVVAPRRRSSEGLPLPGKPDRGEGREGLRHHRGDVQCHQLSISSSIDWRARR
ncbi:MAG: hypothetical protein ABR609_05810, partial [Acidimicrobiia bacterium]